MFIKTFQKCSFLSIPQVNDDFTLMRSERVNEGQGQDLWMKTSLCLPGDYPSTLTTNHLAI